MCVILEKTECINVWMLNNWPSPFQNSLGKRTALSQVLIWEKTKGKGSSDAQA